MVDGDFALLTRIHMLRNSLQTVHNALDDLETCRNPSGGTGLPPMIEDLIRGSQSLIAATRQTANEHPGSPVTDLLGPCADLEKDISQVMKSAWGSRSGGLTFEESGIEDHLRDEVRAEKSALNELELQIRGAGTNDPLRDAWKLLSECKQRCETIFNEYVDLMDGVLARDAGLDHDLCRVADELVRQFGRFPDYAWTSITIPAYRERSNISTARLIRIGFPEWTVWTLPLTAHEFGHVFATLRKGMPELADNLSRDVSVSSDQARTLIADAFATRVMGPAFVWCAALFRADPTDSFDQLRVQIMLQMLGASNEELDPFNLEVERLRTRWADTVDRTGTRDPGIEAALISFEPAVQGVLQRSAIEFGPREWGRAQELATLIHDQPEGDDADLDQRAETLAAGILPRELRHLVAAAWIERIQLVDDARAQGSPLDVATTGLTQLEDFIRQLCVRILDRGLQSTGAPVHSKGLVATAQATAGKIQPRGGAT
jgi:hypothetical protein